MTTTTTRFRALGDALRGGLIMPGDDGYDHARELFYGGMDRRPAAVARVADAADVARAVTFARETETPLSVRGGGHSGAGHSVIDDALTIDLADLRSLEIDAGERVAWAHAGLTAGEYTVAAAEHGLATAFGDSGSVGIGGITLGGGVGFLARPYGLTIDSLIAAEVVTADGELRHVDDERHPDLFWAIRGGGGNFGVVTRLRLRLHNVGTLMGGLLFLPATPETIMAFVAEAQAAPDELTTIANVMPAPPMPFLPEEFHGSLVIFAMLTCVGDLEDGERAIAPFRSIAPPIADMVRPMSYPEMYMPEEEGYHPIGVVRSSTPRPRRGRTIVEHLEASTAMMRGADPGAGRRRVGGGERLDRVRPPGSGDHDQHGGAVRAGGGRGRASGVGPGFASALAGDDLRAYVNFLVDEGPERVRQAYPGATWGRLRSIGAPTPRTCSGTTRTSRRRPRRGRRPASVGGPVGQLEVETFRRVSSARTAGATSVPNSWIERISRSCGSVPMLNCTRNRSCSKISYWNRIFSITCCGEPTKLAPWSVASPSYCSRVGGHPRSRPIVFIIWATWGNDSSIACCDVSAT